MPRPFNLFLIIKIKIYSNIPPQNKHDRFYVARANEDQYNHLLKRLYGVISSDPLYKYQNMSVSDTQRYP